MSIFVTGDIHGEPFPRMRRKLLPNGLTKDDYFIICGDFGLVWDWHGETRTERYYLNLLEEMPFTVLFVDGNHENFDRLNAYPQIDWHGGKVHPIRPHVLHLMRGYVFDIDGKKVFAMGGASYHDVKDGILDPHSKADVRKYEKWKRTGELQMKQYRVLRQSWWPEELPNDEEYFRAKKSLDACNWTVDFVITHSPSSSVLAQLGHGAYKTDRLSNFLEEVRQKATYKHWYCGHMHVNRAITAKDIVIYKDIEQIW